MNSDMRADHVLLCVSGCIAAYKSCEVLRELQKAGCDVRVVMTQAATRFVGPTTFEALSGHAVACDLFDYPESAIPHVFLANWADLVLVCPATADVIAKVASGVADDCLTSTLVATHSPVVVAPAMNVNMWRSAATQSNVAVLVGRGFDLVGPGCGRLACGDVGEGKLAPVADIVSRALQALGHPQDLAGRTVLVTAGPTHEPIDPVRFISNASSGKMGYAVASALIAHGAHVILVSGPTSLAAPQGAELVDVTTAAQMLDASVEAFARCDAAVCAAAVSDYTPVVVADHKLKKRDGVLDSIELTQTADVLATLAASKGRRVVVGFAAETDDLLSNAREKLASKGCDLIVANDVSRADSTFGSDTDAVTLVGADTEQELPCQPKEQVAEALATRLAQLLGDAPSEARPC